MTEHVPSEVEGISMNSVEGPAPNISSDEEHLSGPAVVAGLDPQEVDT